jgi:hypothetical protein
MARTPISQQQGFGVDVVGDRDRSGPGLRDASAQRASESR